MSSGLGKYRDMKKKCYVNTDIELFFQGS